MNNPINFSVGIWGVASVEDDPEVLLNSWQVYCVTNDSSLDNSNHLVGYESRARQGRVSSAIKHFDPTTRTVITTSGRKYLLEGEPGFDSDANYVWGHWTHLNDIKVCTSATDTFVKLINDVK